MTIAQKIGMASAHADISSRAKDFATLCQVLMLTKGYAQSALDHAGKLSPRVVTVLKDSVAGMISPSDLASFAPLAQGFSATLANVAAFDGILVDAIQAPLRSLFGVTITDASAAAVGEGAAKPLARMTLGSARLQERKAAAIVVASDDLLRFGAGSTALLENSLRTGVAAATDGIFIAAMIAATTPIASSGDIFSDLRTAMDAAGSGSRSRFHLIVGPDVARHLALTATTTGAVAFPEMTVTGGVLPGGITVHASDALTDDALLIDASALVANADAIRIRVSQEAALEMDTAPQMATATGSPPAPALPAGSPPSGLVSMFQSDCTAILCERIFGFELLRASAAQSFSGLTWGLTGSPLA